MKKSIRNANAVARKLGPALIKATNHKLKVAREEYQKKKEMIEKRKIKAMAARRQRARRGISLSNEEEENYEKNTGDKTDLDQASNDKNPLQS